MKTSTPKLLLGAHLSGAGGLENALYDGQKINCTAVQIFTHSNRQWHISPLSADAIERFLKAKKETGISEIVTHASYLINLASGKAESRAISLKTLVKELERCEQLGIKQLVLHPGSYVDETQETGIANIIAGLDEALKQVPGEVNILLETMAGQGSSIGHQFEQLAHIRSKVSHKKRIGVCLDTCHIFAAGYDFTTPAKYQAMIEAFDTIIGLEHLQAIHLNDSKKGCGARVDRHAHIGEGAIGLEAFKLLMNDPRLFAVPKILETPKEETLEHDIKNLSVLRGLLSAENKKLFGE